jgi:hypothetical protein
MKTISVRVHISLEDIENLLYSAGQGIKYWGYSELEYESCVKRILDGKDVVIEDQEGSDEKGNAKTCILNLKKVKRGITILAKKYFHHLNDIKNGNTDMYTGDALLQCALFGDIIYS